VAIYTIYFKGEQESSGFNGYPGGGQPAAAATRRWRRVSRGGGGYPGGGAGIPRGWTARGGVNGRVKPE